MISNNYFKGSTLNVSPLCQGCALIHFAERNDIMFHQCEICQKEQPRIFQGADRREILIHQQHPSLLLHQEAGASLCQHMARHTAENAGLRRAGRQIHHPQPNTQFPAH